MTTEKETERIGAEGTICVNGTIAVNALKLSRGLKTTFEGIALVFDSLGAGAEFQESLSSAQEVSAHAAPRRDSPARVEATVREQPPEQAQSEPQEIQPADPASANPASVNLAPAGPANLVPDVSSTQAAPTEPVPASSLTIDDITKIIVSKIKQNRSNNEKIEKLVQSFGVSSVKAIPPEKYEVFMTELAAI